MSQAFGTPARKDVLRQLAIALTLVSLYLALSILWQDLSFYDESNSLDSGLYVRLSWFWNKLSMAPLYAMWYRVLAFLAWDAVVRFFTGWVLTVLLLGCLPALLRVRFAWVYAAVLVALPTFSLGTVALFAAIVPVACVCRLLRHRLPLAVCGAVACACCFVVAFIRPEYAYGVFLAAVATLVISVLTRKRLTSSRAAVTVTVPLLLSALMAGVILHSDSARSGQAFAQHYNLRAAQRGVPFPTSTQNSSYAYEAFHLRYEGNPVVNRTTIGDFARANPVLFLQHVLRNAVDPFFLVAFGFVLAGVATALFRRSYRGYAGPAVFVLLAALPVIASSLLIYPRHHYALIVLPAALLLNLQVFGPLLLPERVPQPWRVVLAMVPLLLLFPGYKLLRAHHVPRPRTALADVRCLRALERTAPGGNMAMFDPSGIPGVYLSAPRQLTPVYEFSTWPAFSQWVAQQKPGWVPVTPFVAEQYAVSSETMRVFLSGHLGYTEHPCPSPSSMTVYTLDGATR